MKSGSIFQTLSLVSHLTLAFCGAVLLFAAVSIVALPMVLCMNVRLEETDMLGHVIEWIQMTVCFLTALFFAIRHWHRQPPVPDDAPKSRGQSYLLWATAAFDLIAIGENIVWHTSHFYHWGWQAGLLFLLFAPIVPAVFWPFPAPQQEERRGVHFIAFFFALLLFLFSGCACAMIGGKVDYVGDRLEEAPNLLPIQREIYFPENATKFRICGRTSAFYWECQSTEEDFQKFMEDHNWEFQLVSEGEPKKFWFRLGKINCPLPYYFYEHRYSNGGGISLCYCTTTQKFYGNVSDR